MMYTKLLIDAFSFIYEIKFTNHNDAAKKYCTNYHLVIYIYIMVHCVSTILRIYMK